MPLPILSDFILGNPLRKLSNVRFLVFQDLSGKTYSGLGVPFLVASGLLGPGGLTSAGGKDSIGGLGGLGSFGLSSATFGMTGEIEKARLDILERMKRTTDSRAKSRLTLPSLFGDGKTQQNILADVL